MIGVAGGGDGVRLGRRVRHGNVVVRLIIREWDRFELFCDLGTFYLSISRIAR